MSGLLHGVRRAAVANPPPPPPPPAPVAWQPSDISGLTIWYKADTGVFQDDGKTTAAAVNGDPVGAWENQVTPGTNDVTQATSANKANYLAVGGDFVVEGVASDFLTNTTRSGYSFMHDGSNWLMAAVVNVTLASPATNYRILTEGAGAAVTKGFAWRYDDVGDVDDAIMRISDGTSYIIDSQSADGGMPPATWQTVFITVQVGAGDDMTYYRDNSSVMSAEPSGAYSAGDAGADLSVFGDGQNFVGSFAEILIWNLGAGTVSAGDLAEVQSYLEGRWPNLLP